MVTRGAVAPGLVGAESVIENTGTSGTTIRPPSKPVVLGAGSNRNTSSPPSSMLSRVAVRVSVNEVAVAPEPGPVKVTVGTVVSKPLQVTPVGSPLGQVKVKSVL